jgi:hypothetical protein
MPDRSVSSACLLRQVSSGLSRNRRNERRPDVEEAWFVAINFMARPLALAASQSPTRTGPSCPGNRHSDRNLGPQRLCDRSYDEVDQTLARQRSFF